LPKYFLTKRALSDLREIARYTTTTWSVNQAIRYISQIHSRLKMLGENPGMGRSCDAVSPGLRRHEHGKHVIFYRIKPEGIRVSRILHQQMIPLKTHFES
jgi:toxin ParE1/3/4